MSGNRLKTFVEVAERCLHDEPKKWSHVVINLELALQQQENVESLAPKERTNVENIFSSTDKSQKENMNFMVPNEKINVPDDASPSPAAQTLPQPKLRIFTFSELKAATKKFSRDTLLGKGAFGEVYKGWLNEKSCGKAGSPTVIAVKKLNPKSEQGFQEWQVIQLF